MYADKRKFFRRNRPKASDNSVATTMNVMTTDVSERQNVAVSPTSTVSALVVNDLSSERNADESFAFSSSAEIDSGVKSQHKTSLQPPPAAADSLLDVEMSELDSLPSDDDPVPTRNVTDYGGKDDDMGMTFALSQRDLFAPSSLSKQNDNNSLSPTELTQRSQTSAVSPEKNVDDAGEIHRNSYDVVTNSTHLDSNNNHEQHYGQTAASSQSHETIASAAVTATNGSDTLTVSNSSTTGTSSSAAAAETTSSSSAGGGGVTVGNFAICTNRRRVKLYALNSERHWDDKGTGHVIVTVHNTPAETEAGIEPTLSLLVRDENDGTELLSSRVRLDTSYQRQQETLIVWSEKGSDLALSFQERVGCEDVWAKICEIQGKDPSVEVTQECVDDDDEELGLLGSDAGGGGGSSGTGFGGGGSGSGMSSLGGSGGSGGGGGGGMMSSVSAPLAMRPPTIGNLEAIQKTIKQCMQSPVERERLSIALEQDNYLTRLIGLFRQCEEVDDLHALYCLHNIVYNILMLNKNALYERVFSEENIDAVLGALEYDPKVCAGAADPSSVRKQHRRIVHKDARFREIVPIPNADIRSKIIQTYKVQYIHDIILPTPTVFEDNMLSALSSFLFFNKVEITSQLQEDEVFLQALIDAVLVDEKTVKNSADVLRRRRDVFAFWKEYCAFSHTLQAGNRDMFYRAMIDQGILKAIEVTIKTCKDTETRSLVLEVFSYLIEFGPQAMIRDYCLSQVQMGSQQSAQTSQQYRPLTFGNSSNFSQRSQPSSQPLSQHYGGGRSQSSLPLHSAAAAGNSESKMQPNNTAAGASAHDPNDFDERSLFLNVIIRELVCGGSSSAAADSSSSSNNSADSDVDINIVIQLMSVLRVLLDPENMTANVSLGGGGQSTNPKTEFLAFFYRHCIQHLLEPLMKHTEIPKHGKHAASSNTNTTSATRTPVGAERNSSSKSLKSSRRNSTESLVEKASQEGSDNLNADSSQKSSVSDKKVEGDETSELGSPQSKRHASGTDDDENESYVCNEKPMDVTVGTEGDGAAGVVAVENHDDDDLAGIFVKSKKLRTSPSKQPTSPVAESAAKHGDLSSADNDDDDIKSSTNSLISKSDSNVEENQQEQQSIALLRRRMLPMHELLRERAQQAAARISNGITAGAAAGAADVSPRSRDQQQRFVGTSDNTASSSGRAPGAVASRFGSLANASQQKSTVGGQQNPKRFRPNNSTTSSSAVESVAVAVPLPQQQYYVVAPRLLTAQLLNQIVELISFCIDHHTFYIKNYVIGKNLLGKVLVLMRSPHMFLVCTALRALRKIVGLNNEFYNRYIQRNDLLRGVIERFLSNGKRYNLFNSAVLELFEHIRQDDNDTLGTYVLDRYWDKLKDITYVKTFQELRKKFEKQRPGRVIGGGGSGVGGGGGGLMNDSDEEEAEEEEEMEDERAGMAAEELEEDEDEEEDEEEEDEEIEENYDDDEDDEEDDGTVITHLAASALPTHSNAASAGVGFGLGSTSSPIAQRSFGLAHRQHSSSSTTTAGAGGGGGRMMRNKSHQRVESGVVSTNNANVKSGRSAPPLAMHSMGASAGKNSGVSAVRHHHHHHRHSPSSHQHNQQRSHASVKQQQNQLVRQLSRDDDGDDDEEDEENDEKRNEETVGVVRLMGTASRSPGVLTQHAKATSPSKFASGAADADKTDEKTGSSNAAIATDADDADNTDEKSASQEHREKDDAGSSLAATDAGFSQSSPKSVAPPTIVISGSSHDSPSLSAATGDGITTVDSKSAESATTAPSTTGTGHRTFFPLSPMAAALAATAAAAAVEHHQRQQQQHQYNSQQPLVDDDSSSVDAGSGNAATASFQPVTTASTLSSTSASSSSTSSSPSSPTTSILTALANVINTQIDAVSGPVVGTMHSGSSSANGSISASSSSNSSQHQAEPNNSKLRLTFRRIPPTRDVVSNKSTNLDDAKPSTPTKAVESDRLSLRLSRPTVNGHHQQATSGATATAALAFADEEKDAVSSRESRKSLPRSGIHFKPRTNSSSALDLRRRRDEVDDDDESSGDAAKKVAKLHRTHDAGSRVGQNRVDSTMPVADVQSDELELSKTSANPADDSKETPDIASTSPSDLQSELSNPVVGDDKRMRVASEKNIIISDYGRGNES